MSVPEFTSLAAGYDHANMISTWDAPLTEVSEKLPRKEVIHPQLPLGMPCYDLALVTDLTLATPTRRFRYYQLPSLDGR